MRKVSVLFAVLSMFIAFVAMGQSQKEFFQRQIMKSVGVTALVPQANAAIPEFAVGAEEELQGLIVSEGRLIDLGSEFDPEFYPFRARVSKLEKLSFVNGQWVSFGKVTVSCFGTVGSEELDRCKLGSYGVFTLELVRGEGSIAPHFWVANLENQRKQRGIARK